MDFTDCAFPRHIVVAGGGPAGLFTAWKLVQEGHCVTVLEREAQVGGLAASMPHGGNHYSFGTHHLHSPKPEDIEPFRHLMGDELVELDRKLMIKFMGRFYPYPLKTGDLIRGLKWPVLAASTASLAHAMIKKRLHDKAPRHAEDAVIQLYGRRLYDLMFRDYTTRFWGTPPTEISSTFVDKRMPGISAVEGMKKLLAKLHLVRKSSLGKTVQIGSGKMYTTPEGIGRVYEAMAREIARLGGTVSTSSELAAIHVNGDLVEAVSLRGSQGETRIPCDLLVSTIPVNHLVQRLDPPPPAEVVASARELKFRALMVGGFLIRPKRPLDALFTYFPDRSFLRLAELSPPSAKITPEGSSILLAEFTCNVGDEVWRDPGRQKQRLIDDLVAEGLVEPDGVLDCHFFRAPEAYPKYFLGFEPHLERIQAHLAGYENLLSTGRQGGFQFTSMIPTMKQAWAATQELLARLEARAPAAPVS